MDTMDAEKMKEAFQLLRNTPIETPILIGTMAHLWYMIENVYIAYMDTIKHEELVTNSKMMTIDGNQLHNIIQMARTTIAQLASKHDMVEILTKRQRAFDSLLQLEMKILNLCNKQFALVELMRSPAIAHFMHHTDIQQTTHLLLNLKHYLEKYSPGQYSEYAACLNALLEIVYGQRVQLEMTCIYLPRDAAHLPSFKEITATFCLLTHRRTNLTAEESEQLLSEQVAAYNKSYGVSYRGLWSGCLRAVKKINKRIFPAGQEIRLRDALLSMEYLQEKHPSPYLAQLVGLSWDRDLAWLYLISPLAPSFSLYDRFTNPLLIPANDDSEAAHISSDGFKLQLTPLQKLSILLDMSQALQHLHSCGMTHGRFKDSNVLLYEMHYSGGGGAGGGGGSGIGTLYRAKLGDFGMHAFLAGSTRSKLKGREGLRWTAPEVVQAEQRLEDLLGGENSKTKQPQMAGGPPPTLETLSIQCTANPLSPAVDVYGLGLLAIVLLTEQGPFFNLPYQAAVKQVLLEGSVPSLTAQYPAKEVFARYGLVEQLVEKTVCVQPGRRSAARPLVDYLEQTFCQLHRDEQQALLDQREEEIVTVRQELADIEKKLRDTEIYLTKGQEIIQKKEMDKIRLTNQQQRFDRDREVERARSKLIEFKQEYEGLKEDKEGAEADLEHLLNLKRKIAEIVAKPFRSPLEGRRHIPEASQETLLHVYCDSYEQPRYLPLLSMEDDAALPSGQHSRWPPQLLATSPFAPLYSGSPSNCKELTASEIDVLQHEVQAGSWPYRHLVAAAAGSSRSKAPPCPDIDIIFRTPVHMHLGTAKPCPVAAAAASVGGSKGAGFTLRLDRGLSFNEAFYATTNNSSNSHSVGDTNGNRATLLAAAAAAPSSAASQAPAQLQMTQQTQAKPQQQHRASYLQHQQPLSVPPPQQMRNSDDEYDDDQPSQLQQSQQAGAADPRTLSVMSEESSARGTRYFRRAPTATNNAAAGQEIDSDDDYGPNDNASHSYSYSQQQPSRDLGALSRERLSSRARQSISQNSRAILQAQQQQVQQGGSNHSQHSPLHANQPLNRATSASNTIAGSMMSLFAGQLKDLESYEIQLSSSLIRSQQLQQQPAMMTVAAMTAGQAGYAEDDFPLTDFDIIHVQYLAAARGNWAEAVGMRRVANYTQQQRLQQQQLQGEEVGAAVPLAAARCGSLLGFPDETIAAFLDNNFTPLHVAAFLGNMEILLLLIQQAGLPTLVVDINGESLLHVACKRGHVQIVRYLCETYGGAAVRRSASTTMPTTAAAPADAALPAAPGGLTALAPDQPNHHGITPLQYALKGGFTEIILYFLEENSHRLISPNYVDEAFGASLLHWACLSQSWLLIDYLITQHHLQVEMKAKCDQATCLLWACYASNVQVVKYLIEKMNAHPHVRNQGQMTCLHMATMSGDKDKVNYLMDQIRLKVTDKDSQHRTPFDVATGSAALMLKERKEKGFVTGSIAEKMTNK